MIIDHSSLMQLGIFGKKQSDYCIFQAYDFTVTNGGREELKTKFLNPLKSIEEIKQTHDVITFLNKHNLNTIEGLNNGMLFTVEKYLNDNINFNSRGSFLDGIFIPLVYNANFKITKFSILQIKELVELVNKWILQTERLELPILIKKRIEECKVILQTNNCFISVVNQKHISNQKVLEWDYYFRRIDKASIYTILTFVFSLDAYMSMSLILKNLNCSLPVFKSEPKLDLNIKQFHHPLLQKAKKYNLNFEEGNFLFTTGANMSGKSTFLRTIGAVVYMAHLGIPVPCESMSLTFLDGLSASILIEDNLLEGESYFYNEVKRVNEIIQNINRDEKWLVLLDELFKGTNFQDAMMCSKMIISGLLSYNNCAFVLSTHLYQLAEELKDTSGLFFKYFETVYDAEDNYSFTYQLKEGVSKDTIGYKILLKSGVIDKMNLN